MVDLSNAADKATERAAARNLERKNLDGEKINSGEAYDNEHSEYGTLSDSVTGAGGSRWRCGRRTLTLMPGALLLCAEIIAPPAERAIFILLQIMHKINEHCAAASE